MKGIVVLGSTGSIGAQTLEILSAFPQDFAVLGLSAWQNHPLLLQQTHKFKPPMIYCQNGVGTPLPDGCRFTPPEEMVMHPQVDMVVLATVGKAGLLPALRALQAGKTLALANKEVIVMAGEFITAAAQKGEGSILPVDSEPSAIWQCLAGEGKEAHRLIITASGGPFRTWPLEALERVTPEEALKHPTWRMGRKITIDSATLMNKAFEVIEARWLFSTPWEKIEVVLHPQSIIHSMVEFVDGSLKAQLSVPDMRIPIQYALFYPRRVQNQYVPHLDLLQVRALTFEPLDLRRYPCFSLALDAAKQGGTYPAVLAAADEVAVELFLARRIPFTSIHRLIAEPLERHRQVHNPSLEDILEADAWARQQVYEAAEVRR